MLSLLPTHVLVLLFGVLLVCWVVLSFFYWRAQVVHRVRYGVPMTKAEKSMFVAMLLGVFAAVLQLVAAVLRMFGY